MAKRKVGDLATVVNDSLSYILVYAPQFPAEDQTNTEQEFDRLLARVHELWNAIQDVERRRWLDLVGKEIVEARLRFLSGDGDAGRTLVESAQHHFKAWCERKKVRPTFIVGPGGQVDKA